VPSSSSSSSSKLSTTRTNHPPNAQGLGGDYYSTSAGQRDRMLVSTERLQKTSERLQLGKQQLAETEELGVTILGDLARQRETIVHARDTLHGADDNISKARRVLSTMSKRVMANKIIMFGIW